MRIGIDIDDVITKTSEKVKEYLEKYEKSGDGMKYIVEVMRGEAPTKNIQNFFDEYMSEVFSNVELNENALEVINRFLNEKNEIILITSRGEQRFKNSEKATIEYLKKHNVRYTNLVFNTLDKQIYCKENNIQIMIDDSVKTCELVKQAGISAIVFTTEINKNIGTDIKRVESWLELEKEIGNII